MELCLGGWRVVGNNNGPVFGLVLAATSTFRSLSRNSGSECVAVIPPLQLFLATTAEASKDALFLVVL